MPAARSTFVQPNPTATGRGLRKAGPSLDSLNGTDGETRTPDHLHFVLGRPPKYLAANLISVLMPRLRDAVDDPLH